MTLYIFNSTYFTNFWFRILTRLDDLLGFFRYQKHFMSQFYSLSVSFSEIYKWLIHPSFI